MNARSTAPRLVFVPRIGNLFKSREFDGDLTPNVMDAMHFEGWDECASWCAENPVPEFTVCYALLFDGDEL